MITPNQFFFEKNVPVLNSWQLSRQLANTTKQPVPVCLVMIELATAKSIVPEHEEHAPSNPRFVCSRVDVYFSCLAFVASISFSIFKFYLLENDEYASSTLLFEVRRVIRLAWITLQCVHYHCICIFSARLSLKTCLTHFQKPFALRRFFHWYVLRIDISPVPHPCVIV